MLLTLTRGAWQRKSFPQSRLPLGSYIGWPNLRGGGGRPSNTAVFPVGSTLGLLRNLDGFRSEALIGRSRRSSVSEGSSGSKARRHSLSPNEGEGAGRHSVREPIGWKAEL